ncbi:hypothetical protein GCM10029964_054580 [Kibdelosporangium lantanae]
MPQGTVDANRERGRTAMTATTTINREEWMRTLDQLTAAHEGEQVTIEVLDPEVGHQHEVELLPFTGLTYDPHDDVVVVSVGGRSSRFPVVLRHMVWHPTEVSVQEAPSVAVRVVEPDTTTTLILFDRDQDAAA